MNPFLTPLAIINYYVYRFYQRWEGDPVGWTIRLVGLFFFLNILSFFTLAGSVSVMVPNGNYYALTLPLMAVLTLTNYLLIFRGNKHHESFSIIASRIKPSYAIFFWLYFAITTIPTAIMVFNKFPGRH